ncbi:hypothetical protein TNCV_2278111 [Trichonephila clavipes]|nr:hypothetical protein TNCV_2278111 [Trichonephila clavipes]
MATGSSLTQNYSRSQSEVLRDLHRVTIKLLVDDKNVFLCSPPFVRHIPRSYAPLSPRRDRSNLVRHSPSNHNVDGHLKHLEDKLARSVGFLLTTTTHRQEDIEPQTSGNSFREFCFPYLPCIGLFYTLDHLEPRLSKIVTVIQQQSQEHESYIKGLEIVGTEEKWLLAAKNMALTEYGLWCSHSLKLVRRQLSENESENDNDEEMVFREDEYVPPDENISLGEYRI